MVQTMTPNEMSVNTLMGTLSAEYPVKATQQLEGEYRRRFMRLLLVHGIGGSPAALNQPQQPEPAQAPQVQQSSPQNRASVEMDSI